MSRVFTFVEIDIYVCTLTYGTAPCTASIPTTGTRKCYNGLGTCQDRPNFATTVRTLTFRLPTQDVPFPDDAIPSLRGVSYSPSTLSLGEDLGIRANVTCTFEDHPWSDSNGFDKYLSERPFKPFTQGTFWGKFRVRNPHLRGRALRLIRKRLTLEGALETYDTRHFVIDSFDGPGPSGQFTINAKDALKTADGDRAQAPVLSNGFLVANITAAATAATLSPAGIGNLEYPASGHVAIGGTEICSFTRVGDVLTLVRGQLGTLGVTHSQDDRAQLCLRYVAQSPADIIRDLFVNYADVPAAQIPLSNWQAETATYLSSLYTATICEPTSVNELISELIEQAALVVWWDEAVNQIQLRVLRPISTTAIAFDDTDILKNTFQSEDQFDKRITQVWTYFAQINPLRPLTDLDNFRSTAAAVDLITQQDAGSSNIKKIFSRWIPQFGRTIATRLNDILLSRYSTPPRLFKFEVFLEGSDTPILGAGARVSHWNLQDDVGARVTVPVQVTRLTPEAEKYIVQAEELIFTGGGFDTVNRTIVVDTNIFNFNLRTVHDTIYAAPTDADVIAGVNLTCVVPNGITVGGAVIGSHSFHVGSWPLGFPVTIEVAGRIQGLGGKAGDAASGAGDNGKNGNVGLYTRHPINLDVAVTGKVDGGGGGGGGGVGVDGSARCGGGGGAGTKGGPKGSAKDGGESGDAGTPDAGGDGGDGAGPDGGDGGNPGAPGQGGQGGTLGGAAGAAIDGASFTTIANLGLIRGPQIN